MKYFLLYQILVTIGVWCAANVGAEPNYSVELNSFEPSKDYDDSWVDWNTLRMKKVGRNKFALTGDFTIKKNLGDQQKIALQVFKYDGGAKQKGPLVMNVNKPYCQFVNEDEDTYPGMVKASNLPEKGTCPFPKGEYSVNNYEAETNFLPDDTPKGDYLIVVLLTDNEIGVAGIEAYVTLT